MAVASGCRQGCPQSVRTGFAAIRDGVTRGREITEYDVQQEMVRLFSANNLVTDEPPCVAVNANTADPHYSPAPDGPQRIREGDFVLIDVWAKLNQAGRRVFRYHLDGVRRQGSSGAIQKSV